MLVAGHPRSGTTLLNLILNTHPDILSLFEFRVFHAMGARYDVYKASLRRNWYKRRILKIYKKRFHRQANILASGWFRTRYLWALSHHMRDYISFDIITGCLSSSLPHSPIIGDKYPPYVYNLDRLAQIPSLKRIVIYRDPRAVVRSATEMSRTNWAGNPEGEKYSTVEKVSKTWVKAITMMERNRDHICTIRYEDLVANPEKEVRRLGDYLGVAPEGFKLWMVKKDRVHKYVDELSREDLAIIESIAGPVMRRLGYT